ncbi:MAG: tubulin-like doman-containing protein [Myxococcota bacterium]
MPLRETKIAPVFFLGLGGCGGAIVDELARKVKQEESFQRYSDLIQFFALDTDVDDLARLHWIDTSHKFTLSNFDKPDYVDLKRGQLHAPEDALFTQWWPAWYRPRSTKGKGAGQIRIESRMSLYYQLENDRGKVVEILNKAVRRAYDVHNPYRANKAAKIYVFASLAGGTGSGGFATMALTVRRLLGGQRGHQLIGTFVMPNVFKSKGLPPNQFDKVMANGYSALQELELLQSASPTMPVEFHYDPDNPQHTTIDRPAFDQLYLIEEKTQAGVVIADSSQIYQAVADTAHAQIFSPILDKEGSTLDNDTRELMQLDDQAFTKSFGSFGISALMLPCQDILEYCALRLGRELLVGAVPGGVAALGDGATIDEADEAFARGVADKAEGSSEDAETFARMHAWVSGQSDGVSSAGEGVLDTFRRRCKEEVAKDIDKGIRLRGWDDSELSSFEDDPERVQSELNGAWTALKKQLQKSDDEATRRAQRAATEVIAGTGSLSLAEMTRGKGPTESRYLFIKLREVVLTAQD